MQVLQDTAIAGNSNYWTFRIPSSYIKNRPNDSPERVKGCTRDAVRKAQNETLSDKTL